MHFGGLGIGSGGGLCARAAQVRAKTPRGSVLRLSWGGLGASWLVSGAVLAAKLLPKTHRRSMEKRSRNQSKFKRHFKTHFCGEFLGFLVRKWWQVGRKIGPVTDYMSQRPEGLKLLFFQYNCTIFGFIGR